MKQSSVVGAAGMLGSLSSSEAAHDNVRRGATSAGKVTVTDFSQILGAEFQVQPKSGPPVTVQLIEANSVGSPQTDSDRQPFSVIFRAPAGTRLLQDIYVVRNRDLGKMRLLLVPVDLPRKYSRLEAIFA